MPKLTVVTGDGLVNKPPSKLGRHGSQLWRSIMREYIVNDAADVERLALACEQYDRMHAYRKAIAADGVTVMTKSGVREHPLLKVELAAHSFVSRTLQQIGLGTLTRPVGRPPVQHGWQPDDDS
jgi:phage terminase small subunit